MATFADFYPYLLPQVPGCSDPMATQALRDSAIAFCEDTMVLRTKLPAFATVSGTSTYTPSVSTGEQIARVLGVAVDGVQVYAVAEADAAFPLNQPGKPRYVSTVRTAVGFDLVLQPAPDAAYAVEVEAAMRPTRTATSLPDDLLDRWVEAVVHGAVYRLASVRGQPFSDQVLAGDAMAKYLRMAQKARIDSQFGRVVSSRRVSPIRFA